MPERDPGLRFRRLLAMVTWLAAREKQVPVYAACDSSKFTSEDYCAHLKRGYRAASELWKERPAGIEIADLEFELFRDVRRLGRRRLDAAGDHVLEQERRVGLHRIVDIDGAGVYWRRSTPADSG